MTFFEAVETLKLPRHEDGGDDKKKKGEKKAGFITVEPHHMITSIDLSGFRNLRFSKAGL